MYYDCMYACIDAPGVLGVLFMYVCMHVCLASKVCPMLKYTDIYDL